MPRAGYGSSHDPGHVFTGSPLDRAGNERRDRAWLDTQLAHPGRRFLALRDLEALVVGDSAPAVAWLEPDVLPDGTQESEPVLLGLEDGAPRFAIDLTGLDEAALAGVRAGGRRFAEVRGIAPDLPGDESAVVAQARSYVDWHARHRFCAVCGGATTPRNGGGMRVCEACSAEHFPRVDPVVIVLIVSGERCLLVSGVARPGSNYTCVAGFMEPGETVEEAVRREVREEAGVEVGAVRYHSSQPWPFPASLMLGCHADAASEAIAIDPEEIKDARWFGRADVARALDVAAGAVEGESGLDFGVPTPFTISHQLIRAWAGPSGQS